MSSQILTHGYIEVLPSTVAENEAILRTLVSSATPSSHHLVHFLEPFRQGSRSSTSAFARSFKCTGGPLTDCDLLQREFESLITSLHAIGAQIDIWDEYGEGSRSIQYVYGPQRIGGPDLWMRVVNKRTASEETPL